MLWSQEVVKDGTVRAVVLNSGGANCYTGPEGFQTTHAVAEQVAGQLGIGAIDVVVCSTGLIGLTNDRERPARRRRRGVRRASPPTAATAAAEAIMTTDSVSKQVVVEGAGWSIGGMAKGAGMLAPAARHHARRPHHRRRRAGRRPRHRAAGRHPGQLRPARLRRLHVHQRHRDRAWPAAPAGSRPSLPDFTEALTQACTDLAMQLLRDAEGADHEIAITVLNAATEDEAVEVGRSVARSNLFKAAVFGKDPNWGRVLASIGTTQAAVRPRRPRRRDERRLGLPAAPTPHADPATVDLTGREVTVTIDLKAGTERATVWTNDLTHAYVHENSAYSS